MAPGQTRSLGASSSGTGKRVAADPPEQARSSNKSSNSDSRLLKLPTELRLDIWRLCCTSPPTRYIRLAAADRGLAYSSEVDDDFLFTCKQIREEGRPFLVASIEFHIVYMFHSPAQPMSFPSRRNCGVIESVFFHCKGGRSALAEDRPPRQAVPFRRFPRLKTFTVCIPIYVPIENALAAVAADGTASLMSWEKYDSLSEEEKLTALRDAGWLSAEELIRKVAAFGLGGWLSQVIDPKRYARTHDDFGNPITDDVAATYDSDDEGDGHYYKYYYSTDEESEEARKRTRKRTRMDARDQEVIDKAHTILETELVLHEHRDWYLVRVEKWLVTVDTRTTRVLEARFLSEEESHERYARCREVDR